MIKLFGVMIQLIPSADQDIVSTTTSSQDTRVTSCFLIQDLAPCDPQESCNEEVEQPSFEEDTARVELVAPETSSFNKKNPLQNTYEKGASNETSSSDDMTLKKPDELLPCPRCSSMDTKFCYYNNYNVSQPRHLCKNCQRYWTAGGTMRIMPVGSGRRKNKCSLTSQYRRVNVSETPAFGMIDVEEPENFVSNRCIEDNDSRIPFSYGAQEMGDDNSSGSSSTVLNHKEEIFYTSVESKLANTQESPTQVPCFPVPPWASPWNTAEWMSATQPAFGSPEFPISVYSMPPYWGCPVPNPWKMPWLSLQCSSGKLSVHNPGPNTQTLGKHQRDGSMTGLSEPEKEEKKLKGRGSTPKTPRIHHT